MEYKTIKISKELHKEIKIYCSENDISINKFIEENLNKIIEKLKNKKNKK